MRNIWTLSEAKEMLTLWKNAAKALASGQVKEYMIGSRRLTYIDLEDIYKQISYFSDVISALDGSKNTKSVRTVIPRDI